MTLHDYTVNCQNEIIEVGDLVKYEESVFSSYRLDEPHGKPLGKRFVEVEVLSASKGKKTKVRTLTLLVISSTGYAPLKPHTKIRRLAKNLHKHYCYRVKRQFEDEKSGYPEWWI